MIDADTEYITKAQPPYPQLYISIDKSDQTRKKVDLLISPASMTDSAVYYCALRPTVTGNPGNTVQKA